MPDTRKLLIAGITALLVFTVVQFPAAKAFAWFAPPGVGAFGVSGTVWNGEARLLEVNGLRFSNTQWSLAPWRLLVGQLGGSFRTRWGSGFIEADGLISLTGRIALRNVRGSFDVSPLNTLLNTPGIGGVATVDLQEVEIHDNWPTRIVGTGQLSNLTSALMGRGAAQLIGDIGFEFNSNTETEADRVTGTLKDTGGPLQLEGTLILTPPGNFELKTRVRARPTAAESLRQNLSFLGQPEPDGTRIFQLAGSI